MWREVKWLVERQSVRRHTANINHRDSGCGITILVPKPLHIRCGHLRSATEGGILEKIDLLPALPLNASGRQAEEVMTARTKEKCRIAAWIEPQRFCFARKT